MTSFLDKPPPFDFADPAARDLWTLLAMNYQSKSPVRDMLTQVGTDITEIDWDQPMKWVWADILRLTHRRGELKPLLQAIISGGDKNVGERVKELLAASPVIETPAPAAPTWKGFGGDGLERIIQAESTLLDVAFLRRGIELSPAICRLLVSFTSGDYYGTGFRITDDLLLTNHHVLFDHSSGDEVASKVEAWFGYERTFGGDTLAHTVVAGDVATIRGAKDHDWAVVSLGAAMPQNAPIVALTGATPVGVDDRVYIIQHPAGAPKKIGMIHNVVRHVDEDVVQYLTDTEGGSSGSPVFNEAWQLVALHHQWVEASSNGTSEIRNQGQRIERVVEGLQAAGLI